MYYVTLVTALLEVNFRHTRKDIWALVFLLNCPKLIRTVSVVHTFGLQSALCVQLS